MENQIIQVTNYNEFVNNITVFHTSLQIKFCGLVLLSLPYRCVLYVKVFDLEAATLFVTYITWSFLHLDFIVAM